MEVLTPSTINELLPQIDNEHRRLAAGCTDIIAALRAKKIESKPIIDINSILEIKKIFEDGSKVFIGANVPISTILESDLANENLGLLMAAVKTIGSPQIRNRATLGGNIANASPSGDGILALTLLDAELVLKSAGSQRTVKINDFIKGVGKTDLHNDEFIEYIIIDKKFKGYKSYFEKVGPRNAVTISICSMGILYKLNKGVIEDIKIAYGAVAPKIAEVFEAEELLKGCKIDRKILEQAAAAVEKAVSPIDDVRASAAYRRAVSKNLVMRLMENI